MTTKVEFTVTGMKCGGCEKTIKQALTDQNGIISVEAKHADNWVGIEYDQAALEEDDVIELIEEAGFTVQD